ncbi:hypothetical protein GCM10027613_10270 [Microlunatus endophyticus]
MDNRLVATTPEVGRGEEGSDEGGSDAGDAEEVAGAVEAGGRPPTWWATPQPASAIDASSIAAAAEKEEPPRRSAARRRVPSFTAPESVTRRGRGGQDRLTGNSFLTVDRVSASAADLSSR